jgi:hypothetical protein
MAYKISISKVKELNQSKGHYFFSRGATDFFKSKYPKEAIVKGNYAYFITSETDPSGKTAYSIRKANLETGDIRTSGDFHSYETRNDAQSELNKQLFEIDKESTEQKDKFIEPIKEEEKEKGFSEYDLEPRYDSRKSFYGKARVEKDKGKLTLFSYNTRVAEIENGKPIVHGKYSSTTLRHIKEFLKQEGFKAETSKQIMKDYGEKDDI